MTKKTLVFLYLVVYDDICYTMMMTVNERLAYARKKMHLTQAQFSEKICVTTGFLGSMEIGDRKVNSRMIKLINLTTGISSKWLETGEGEMFASEPDKEIEEIVNLYRQLNPFFKGYFKRQLLEIINYENSTRMPKGD